MWGFFLADGPVTDYASAKTANTELFKHFFHALLDDGVYIAPSQFEAAFVSTAHDADILGETRASMQRAMQRAVSALR
jgi:glutamate-1-semialdehyde 2,1-aminomutase